MARLARSVIAFLLPSVALAQGSPYSFTGASGTCPSQGAWTQAAIKETQNIHSIIESLMNDPNCKGIESIVPKIAKAQAGLSEGRKGPEGSGGARFDPDRVESLIGEIGALKSVFQSGTGGTNRASVAKQLYTEIFNAAATGGSLASDASVPMSAIQALYGRTVGATRTGIDMMGEVFQILPRYEQCLIGNPDQGLALLSAAVKVGASFASSGEGAGSKLANAMAGFTTMLRNMKFATALRTTQETQLWLSVSCLIESVAKNYCEAHNAQELLNYYAQSRYQKSMAGAQTGMRDPHSDNPLEGYYLLIRDLPLIAQWLRTVKLGTDPRTSADATYQSEALDAVNEFNKVEKQLRALYHQQRDQMAQQQSTVSRRNILFQMIEDLVNLMVRNPLSGPFFKSALENEQLIPFYLIGMDRIPEACRVRIDGLRAASWNDWMSAGNNGVFQPEFSDPDKLAETVYQRLNLLIEAANRNSSVFFRVRLVNDQENLLNKTLSGSTLTVREALQHVDRYLMRFETRLDDSDVDTIMLPSVRETRARIGRVLKAYGGMNELGNMLKKPEDLVKLNISAETRANSGNLIQVVFEEFNLIRQHDIFLTNRVTTFIQRDFAKRIRSGEGMTKFQREILVTSQDHLVDKLLNVYNSDPVKAGADLAIAQEVNITNLGTVEDTFADTMYVVLEKFNQIVQGKPSDPATMNALARKRYREASHSAAKAIGIPGSPMNRLNNTLGINRLFAPLVGRFFVKPQHPELYRTNWGAHQTTRGDDEHGSRRTVRNLLCAQTLAFQGRSRFIPFCKGAVVKSFYSKPDEHSPLNLTYDDYLPNENYDYAVIKKDPVKERKRICAVNDYYIRNWVRLLEDRDRRQDAERTQDEPAPSAK